MNKFYVAASFVAVLTTLIHLVLGHYTVELALLAAPFDDDVAKRTLHACWHIVSVDLGLSALGLLAAGLRPRVYAVGRTLPVFIAIHYVLWTVAFLVIGLATMPAGGLFARLFVEMPQWILFAPVIGLVALGTRK